MTLWGYILLACAVTYLTKLAGYAIPARWLQNPRMTRVAGAMTVALLAALTVMNTVASGGRTGARRAPGGPGGGGTGAVAALAVPAGGVAGGVGVGGGAVVGVSSHARGDCRACKP